MRPIECQWEKKEAGSEVANCRRIEVECIEKAEHETNQFVLQRKTRELLVNAGQFLKITRELFKFTSF